MPNPQDKPPATDLPATDLPATDGDESGSGGLDALSGLVTFRIAQVHNLLNAQAIAILRERSDLNLTEWRIIQLIQHLGAVTAATLSRVSGIDKSQISRAVATLTRKGHISQSHQAGDMRRSDLALTDSGRALHQRLFGTMLDRHAYLTAGLSDGDFAALKRALGVLESAAAKRDF